MNWIEIEKEDLIKAIKILELVPMRSGTPTSDYIRVIPTKKHMELAMASSVSAVVRVPWKAQSQKEGGAFYIDRRLLTPFVLMGDKWKGNFNLELEETQIRLKQGSRRAELGLRTDPVDGYGQWRDLVDLKELKLTEELRKLLIASNHCSTADLSMQHLNCVYIGGRVVLATNHTVLFMGVSKNESKIRIPFPVGVIPLLGEGLVKAVSIEGNLVTLDCGCGYIQGTVSAIAEKDFPKRKIFEQVKRGRNWPLIAKIPAVRLTKMMTRLANYLVGMKREDWVLRLELEDSKLRALVRIRQGIFEEKMTVEGLKKEASFEWPLELVQPVLEYMGENAESVKVRVDEEKKTPYLISGAGVDLIVGRRE